MTDQEIQEAAKKAAGSVLGQEKFIMGAKWHRNNDQTLTKVRELIDEYQKQINTLLSFDFPTDYEKGELNVLGEVIAELNNIIEP